MHPKVLLIRHGQTAFNRQGLVHGRADATGLDEVGKAQVSSLVPVCKAHQVKQLMSSPEIRALETAQILAGGLDLQVRQVEALRERDWGRWSGEPWEQPYVSTRRSSFPYLCQKSHLIQGQIT